MVSACSKHALHSVAAGACLPNMCLKTTASRRTHALHRDSSEAVPTAGPTSKRRTSARSVGTIGCMGWKTRLSAAAAYGCPPACPEPRVRATELPCCYAARPASACTLRPTHSVLPGKAHLPRPRQAGPARTWLLPLPAIAPRSPLIHSRQPVPTRAAQSSSSVRLLRLHAADRPAAPAASSVQAARCLETGTPTFSRSSPPSSTAVMPYPALGLPASRSQRSIRKRLPLPSSASASCLGKCQYRPHAAPLRQCTACKHAHRDQVSLRREQEVCEVCALGAKRCRTC